LSSDPDALDIEYLGSCEHFSAIASSITVNEFETSGTFKVAITPAPVAPFDCLPILNAPGSPDYNNLRAEYICNQVGRSRSIIRVVEILDPALATDHPDGGVPIPFILGFHSDKPWRASGSNYIRRPTCGTTNDFCSPGSTANSIVSSCSSNGVTLKDQWVLNNDEVYILPTSFVTRIGSCTSPSAPTTCCTYIDISGNPNNGLCPFAPSNTLFNFEEEHEEHHEEHHDDDDFDKKK